MSSGSSPPAPVRRRALFVALTAFFVLAVIEGGARLLEWASGAWTEAPEAVAENPVPVFEIAEENGVAFHVRTRHHPLMLPDLRFPVQKAPDTYRVFLLGGSAAAGWPYAIGGFGITDALAAKLRMLWPQRRIEVLNLAGGTYASHRVRFVFEEVIEYEPDLVILYSGNNEFLEQFVFRSPKPPAPWDHFALTRLLYRASGALDTGPSFDVRDYTYADQTANRLSYAFGRSSRYREDPEQFRELLLHYRRNIEAMIRGAATRGVPFLLLNVPVNLKDWIPNVSRHRPGLGAGARARWQEHFREGVLAQEAGRDAEALTALDAALSLDDEYAEAHYRRGVALQRLGRTREARAAYVQALERDAYPFRALPEFQAILEELAERYRIPLVDIVDALEARAQDGILGLDVLIDYVHLRPESIEVVAHEIVKAMKREGLLIGTQVPLEQTRVAVPRDFGSAIEFLAANSLYRQNLVMRQYDKLDAVYERFVHAVDEVAREHPEAAGKARETQRLVESVHRAVGPYRKLLRAEKLGLLEQEFTREEARRVYGDYVRAIRAVEAPGMPRNEFRQFVRPLHYHAENQAISGPQP